MSQPINSSSLANPAVGSTGYMDWSGNGLPVQGGKPAQILLQNESGCGLRVKLRGSGRGFDFPAGAWMQGPMPLQPNETGLDFTILYVLPNQPVGLLLGTYYQPGEVAVGVSLGNSPIGLSGTVSATTEAIKMDDKGPGTSIIEATPTDQATSAWALNNDASGFLKVLSANVQRTVLNVVRGNTGVIKAQVQLGDSGDYAVVTYYGQLGRIFSDSDLISSDGAGNLSAVSVAAGTLSASSSLSTDGGDITTDGSGDLTVSPGRVNVTAPDAVGQPPLSLFLPNLPASSHGLFSGRVTGDATSRVAFQIRSDGYGQIILSNTSTNWHLWAQAAGLATDGAIAQVDSVATAGPYGVALIYGVAKDINVTSTVLTNILAVTTPGDGVNHDVEVFADLIVGAANTNNGVVTLQVVYTDPHQGALTLAFNVYGQTNLISGIAQAKGQGIRTEPRAIRCTPNSSVTVQYRNTAAGTISDFSSALVKLMS